MRLLTEMAGRNVATGKPFSPETLYKGSAGVQFFQLSVFHVMNTLSLFQIRDCVTGARCQSVCGHVCLNNIVGLIVIKRTVTALPLEYG